MLTLISPTVWFARRECCALVLAHLLARMHHMGIKLMREWSIEKCLPCYGFLWVSYDFFSLCVAFKRFSIPLHTHAFPKCCPNRNLFCFSAFFLILNNTQKHSIFFSVARSRLAFLLSGQFWYSNNSITMGTLSDERGRMRGSQWGESHHLFRSLNRKVKLTETKRNTLSYFYHFEHAQSVECTP